MFEQDEYRPKLVRTINRRRFDKTLRSIHELCHWGAKEGIKMLSNIHKVGFCVLFSPDVFVMGQRT